MTIEEFFRDGKNRCNGFALRNKPIKHADHFDRLLLILVLAYLLLTAISLVARRSHRPGMWCSSNREKECSNFTMGQRMLDKLQVPIPQAIALFVATLITNSRNCE